LLKVINSFKGVLASSFRGVNHICEESFKLILSYKFIKGLIFKVGLLQVIKGLAQRYSNSVHFTKVGVISLLLSFK
jgi:hypothetical protein